MKIDKTLRLMMALVAMVLTATVACAADTYRANVVGISDGDTIKVIHHGRQIKIRLYGIDTPKKRQALPEKRPFITKLQQI